MENESQEKVRVYDGSANPDRHKDAKGMDTPRHRRKRLLTIIVAYVMLCKEHINTVNHDERENA